jgi:thymidylate kinase
LEGLDRSGKSTLAHLFAQIGYSVIHAKYNPHYDDMYHYYWKLILQAPEPVVFDRSFLAEMVYGPVLRGGSRLSIQQIESLLECLAQKNVAVLYLYEPQEILARRLYETIETHRFVLDHLPELLMAYERCLQIVTRYVPTHTIRPSLLPKERLVDFIVTLINS